MVLGKDKDEVRDESNFSWVPPPLQHSVYLCVPNTACSPEHHKHYPSPSPFTTPPPPSDAFTDPLQLRVAPVLDWLALPQPLLVKSKPGHSLIPVLLGDLVEGPKHSRQHSVAIVLNEAQDILIVPEIQSPLCNLGQRDGRVKSLSGFPAGARPGIKPSHKPRARCPPYTPSSGFI